MKRLFKYLYIPLLLAGIFASCHKIEVPISTELTPSIFPQDSNQFIQASGPAYVALRGNWSTEYFFQQCYSTEVVWFTVPIIVASQFQLEFTYGLSFVQLW